MGDGRLRVMAPVFINFLTCQQVIKHDAYSSIVNTYNCQTVPLKFFPKTETVEPKHCRIFLDVKFYVRDFCNNWRYSIRDYGNFSQSRPTTELKTCVPPALIKKYKAKKFRAKLYSLVDL